ncbi:MAG: twin-arginine translocation signal domain-containing protein, partial [Wenzhouxiangella sp.]
MTVTRRNLLKGAAAASALAVTSGHAQASSPDWQPAYRKLADEGLLDERIEAIA